MTYKAPLMWFGGKYDTELRFLRELFGDDIVEARLPRLESIYFFVKSAWEEQVDALTAKGVKYLLIGEAPPWSEGNEVVYFYNEKIFLCGAHPPSSH